MQRRTLEPLYKILLGSNVQPVSRCVSAFARRLYRLSRKAWKRWSVDSSARTR